VSPRPRPAKPRRDCPRAVQPFPCTLGTVAITKRGLPPCGPGSLGRVFNIWFILPKMSSKQKNVASCSRGLGTLADGRSLRLLLISILPRFTGAQKPRHREFQGMALNHSKMNTVLVLMSLLPEQSIPPWN
jgi:hypothetical protein